MDRCALANSYHEKGYNCAQSVLAAFGDLTHLSEREALAVSGGFGGGVGGTHQEVCGALSGGVMVLSILFPHVEEKSPATKRRLYERTREYRERFARRFGGLTRCGDLLVARLDPAEQSRARDLGITAHCAVLVVTAVDVLEELLREEGFPV
jgi:C_GCAxxG_C_C family probable redox protein